MEPSENMNYKVLLVEDDVNIAKLFSYNLSKAGLKCYVAENGREGFEQVQLLKPDLIISDVMMPEVDGFEFRRMLLQDPVLKKIPFLFLTAKGEDDDILHGFEMEIEDYLIKTASPKVILAKVTAILKSMERERKKVEGEVQKAADTMSAKVVPDEFPIFDGFNIRHWHVPFQNVPGGDFIDYFKVDDDNLVIALGDVMGKKWGAWYFAVAYAGYVRSSIRFVLDSQLELVPSEILAKVNNSIFKDERISEIFITLSVIIINRKKMTADYAGAGDLPLIYKSGETKFIASNGLLLGFKNDGDYKNHHFDLKKNDELFLITDGITESRNTRGEMFAASRVSEVISKSDSSKDTLEELKHEFKIFTNEIFEDDLSVIAIKVL